MTPKEKAKDLVKTYFNNMNENYDCVSWNQAKKCALICANELSDFTFPSSTKDDQVLDEWCSDYWEQVKQEIETL